MIDGNGIGYSLRPRLMRGVAVAIFLFNFNGLVLADTLTGTTAGDLLVGSTADTTITGDTGDDRLFGEAVSSAAVPSTLLGRISETTTGDELDGASRGLVLSKDGTVVAFETRATNLLGPGLDTNGVKDVYIRDRLQNTVTRVSLTVDGKEPDGESEEPSLSPDGSKIVFTSFASNLLGFGNDGNGVSDIYLKNLKTGDLTRISVGPNGQEAIGGNSRSPEFSPDGEEVVFSSRATNLTGTTLTGTENIYVANLATGIVRRVTVANFGREPNEDSIKPHFFPDGKGVVFETDASNLRGVTNDTNQQSDIYIKLFSDKDFRRVSVSLQKKQGNDDSFDPAVSPDGNFIAFGSSASNLILGGQDTNNARDIYIKNLATEGIRRVSLNAAGAQANGDSLFPAFSPDGARIAFSSSASNLVAGDSNLETDIFVKDLQNGAISRVSVDANGGEANNDSFFPLFSRDGSEFFFISQASNLILAGSDSNNSEDIFQVSLASAPGGNDDISGDGDDDLLAGAAGNDKLKGNGGSDILFGHDGDDDLAGGPDVDRLFGNSGKDRLDGGAGGDIMAGGKDDDLYVVESEEDEIFEHTGEGRDAVRASVTFALPENVEDIQLVGAGAINATGNSAGNVMKGNGAVNRLDGAAGPDLITGGRSGDKLTGGAKADRFIYLTTKDSPAGAFDVILDFSAAEKDKIDLVAIDANVKTKNINDAFKFIGSKAFSKKPGELRFKNGFLQGDVNGDGKSDIVIKLKNVAQFAKKSVIL